MDVRRKGDLAVETTEPPEAPDGQVSAPAPAADGGEGADVANAAEQDGGQEDLSAASPLLRDLEERLGVPVLVYWSPVASMGDRVVQVLGRVLAQVGRHDRMALLLCSPGGDHDSAHRMLNVLREYVAELDVYVPTYAASAATMLCLGADRLYMGPLGELSPIDPQVPVDLRLILPMPNDARQDFGHDKPVYVPAGVIRDFLEFAGVISSAQSRPVVDADRLEHLLKPLNPWIIGWYERATKSARSYARQALLEHLLPRTDPSGTDLDQRAERIVSYLTDHYSSHNASISRLEARRVGIPVLDVEPETQALIDELVALYEVVFARQRITGLLESAVAFEVMGATQTMECPGCECRVVDYEEYHYCHDCGAELRPRCGECGQRVPPNWRFCAYCGGRNRRDPVDQQAS